MRLDAHPLVVAVALGLLGPAALDEDEDPTEVRATEQHLSAGVCEDCASAEVPAPDLRGDRA